MTPPDIGKSKIAAFGDEAEMTSGFTERVLFSLVFDISLLHESVERVRVQVMALAKEHGIEAPKL
jgi:hypothetical protein